MGRSSQGLCFDWELFRTFDYALASFKYFTESLTLFRILGEAGGAAFSARAHILAASSTPCRPACGRRGGLAARRAGVAAGWRGVAGAGRPLQLPPPLPPPAPLLWLPSTSARAAGGRRRADLRRPVHAGAAAIRGGGPPLHAPLPHRPCERPPLPCLVFFFPAHPRRRYSRCRSDCAQGGAGGGGGVGRCVQWVRCPSWTRRPMPTLRERSARLGETVAAPPAAEGAMITTASTPSHTSPRSRRQLYPSSTVAGPTAGPCPATFTVVPPGEIYCGPPAPLLGGCAHLRWAPHRRCVFRRIIGGAHGRGSPQTVGRPEWKREAAVVAGGRGGGGGRDRS